MSEYEVHCMANGFSINNLLGAPINNYGALSQKKQTNKHKKRLVILGIFLIKSKEARVITYTYRYSSGHLIPTI